MDSSTDSRRYAHENEPELSPLEQEVLDEYAKLVGNLDDVCIHHFSRSPLGAPLTTKTALRNPSRTGGQSFNRDPRFVARPGAENSHGLHIAESQRVLHCAAAGDQR